MNRYFTCFNVLSIIAINLTIICVAAAGSYRPMTPGDISAAMSVNDGADPSVSAQPVLASYSTGTGIGTLRKAGALWIMNLQGNYYDMGRQYGYLTKGQLLARYAILDHDIGFTNPVVQAALSQMNITMDDRERRLLNGMSLETGLTSTQLQFMGSSIMFSYLPVSPQFGCSVFGATRTQTTTGNTLIGRDFDNPANTINQLAGGSAVIIYKPVGETHGNNHADNRVSVVTTLGWFFGTTVMNDRGLNFEYLNGMISISNLDLTYADGLHQNLYAALDCDTAAEVDARFLNAKVALATLTQVSDETNVWHYERSPFENSMKLLAGQANGGDFYYANPTNMDIFSNHFFLTNHLHQSFLYTSPTNDSGSRSFQRLVNLQTLAQQYVGRVSVPVLQQVMTTEFTNGGTYWSPFISGTADQNVYTCITDVKNRIINVFPSCEREQAIWVELDLNHEFRLYAVEGDIDGDRFADPYWPMKSNVLGMWTFWLSSGGYLPSGPYIMSVPGGVPVAGDFDGDRLADPAMVANGGWTFWFSSGGYLPSGPYVMSVPGDVTPLAGDFDGDRLADPTMVTKNGGWTFWFSSGGYLPSGPYIFSVPGTDPVPMVGDFDGDGLADPTMVVNNNWTFWFSSGGYLPSGPYAFVP